MRINPLAPIRKKWLAKYATAHGLHIPRGYNWVVPWVGRPAKELIIVVRAFKGLGNKPYFTPDLLNVIRPKTFKIIKPRYNWSGALTDRQASPTYIVIHNAAANGVSAQDIHRWHLARGFRGIGYHRYVRQDGTIYQGRPLNAVGAHTLGWNDQIGVCCEGNYDVQKSMPTKQFKALQWCIADIRKRYPTIGHVRGHKEMAGNQTSCPGNHFPLSRVRV